MSTPQLIQSPSCLELRRYCGSRVRVARNGPRRQRNKKKTSVDLRMRKLRRIVRRRSKFHLESREKKNRDSFRSSSERSEKSSQLSTGNPQSGASCRRSCLAINEPSIVATRSAATKISAALSRCAGKKENKLLKVFSADFAAAARKKMRRKRHDIFLSTIAMTMRRCAARKYLSGRATSGVPILLPLFERNSIMAS